MLNSTLAPGSITDTVNKTGLESMSSLFESLDELTNSLDEPTPTAPAPAPAPLATPSSGLSDRHLAMRRQGRTLVDDSNVSEGNLKTAIADIIAHAKAAIQNHGGEIQYFSKISIDDLVAHAANPFHEIGSVPATDDCTSNGNGSGSGNSRTCIRTDAGIILWRIAGRQFPLYIGEDKVQGTNDKLFASGKARQSTGNAIERYFKNVRAEEMLCVHVPYFPSIVFASGCDFHNSETIASRLCAGNYGTPNHYVDLTKDKPFMTPAERQAMIADIRIQKIAIGPYAPLAAIPSVCIKAHKWDELPHNASLWRPDEYLALSKQVIDLSINAVISMLNINTMYACEKVPAYITTNTHRGEHKEKID